VIVVGKEFIENAQRDLIDALEGEDSSDQVKVMVEEFVRLHELYRDRLMAERLEQWMKHHPEHTHSQRGMGVKIALELIDPKIRMLQEHGFDELVFGGFICLLCSPENSDDPYADVMWPCSALRAVGLTEQEAIDHITAQRERWAKEREERHA
jgi:hypothetical protein